MGYKKSQNKNIKVPTLGIITGQKTQHTNLDTKPV